VTITVLYSCGECGIERQPVPIEERGPREDIKAWMDKVTAGLATDHQLRSMGCRSTTLREVMIPAPKGTTRIGEGVRS
jgi:hypothetical protein